MVILNSGIFYYNNLIPIHVTTMKGSCFNLMSFPEYPKEKNCHVMMNVNSLNHKTTLYSDHVCFPNTPYVFLSDACSCTYNMEVNPWLPSLIIISQKYVLPHDSR